VVRVSAGLRVPPPRVLARIAPVPGVWPSLGDGRQVVVPGGGEGPCGAACPTTPGAGAYRACPGRIAPSWPRPCAFGPPWPSARWGSPFERAPSSHMTSILAGLALWRGPARLRTPLSIA
jgi:hypothetical protein